MMSLALELKDRMKLDQQNSQKSSKDPLRMNAREPQIEKIIFNSTSFVVTEIGESATIKSE